MSINITVTVSNDKSTLDTPLYIYQGDFGLDINFKLLSRPFEFKKDTINILNNYDGAYVDVTIVKPDGTELERKNLEIVNGDTTVFTITKDMTDELIEIGDYYLQFHIGNKEDDTDTSYFSIPEFKFTVKKKLTGKITTNLTYIAAEDGTAILDENGEVMICLVEE